MNINLFKACLKGLKTAQHSPKGSSTSHCIWESIIGRHGRFRLVLVKVRGKATLRYVLDRPPSQLNVDMRILVCILSLMVGMGLTGRAKMSEYFFGLHSGHLTTKAQKIAAKHGADHINFTEPGTGQKRGWFACDNRGAPFDQRTANAVMTDIEAAGGLESMKKHR